MQSANATPTITAGPRLIRAALAALLLLGITAVQIPLAHADSEWCAGDPVLVVNGRVVHLTLAVPRDQAGTVTDSTLTVTVPAGVRAHLAASNAQSLITRLRVDVTLVTDATLTYRGTGPVPVRVEATVYAPSTTATRLTASQRGTVLRPPVQASGGQLMSMDLNVQ